MSNPTKTSIITGLIASAFIGVPILVVELGKERPSQTLHIFNEPHEQPSFQIENQKTNNSDDGIEAFVRNCWANNNPPLPDPPKDPVVLTHPEDIKPGMTKEQVDKLFKPGGFSGGLMWREWFYDDFAVRYVPCKSIWRVESVTIHKK